MAGLCKFDECGAEAPGKYGRYCDQHRALVRRKRAKYVPTPEIDGWIREEWGGAHYGRKAALVVAKRCGWPWWAVSKRAVVLGVARVVPKEPDWSAAEIAVLEQFAWMHPKGIQRKLAQRLGTHRTAVAIERKKKRLRLVANLDGYTATGLADLLGLDNRTVARWCRMGWLESQRRGSEPLKAMGRDMWFIPHGAVRRFVVQRPELVDVRKVTDSLWFIDLLTDGAIGKTCGLRRAA